MTQTQSATRTLPNIGTLEPAARKQFMRQKFAAVSRFQKTFGRDSVELDCEAHASALRGEVMRILGAKGVHTPDGKLENLHKTLPAEMKEYNFNDGVNKVSGLLYDTDEQFTKTYHAMIKQSLQKHFPYPFYFQATPTIRIHCPEGKNSDHYPRYHTDINYGHPPEEINIWLPLTQAVKPQYHGFRRACVKTTRDIFEAFDYDFTPFIERAVNDKPFNYKINDSAPSVTVDFGKMSAFDSRCLHTGEPLMHHTRVSMDIRIIAVADFEGLEVEYQGAGRRKMLYAPGQAYYQHSSEQL